MKATSDHENLLPIPRPGCLFLHKPVATSIEAHEGQLLPHEVTIWLLTHP